MAGVEILAVGDEAQAEYEAKNPVVTEEPAPVKEEVAPSEVEENPEAAAPEESDDKPEEEESGKFYWGDIPVEIEVPQEISSAFAEHNIDADKLIGELFSKDGKFELSAETRAPLDKAFGKHIVDGYLNLYKQQNQMFMDNHQKQEEATRLAVEENIKDFDTLVGGDEGWASLNEWAGQNLDEKEIANLNAVMSLPVEHYHAQRTVLEALQIKRNAAASAAEGDTQVNLLSDQGSSAKATVGGSIPSSLTREQFQEIMFSEKYMSDPKYAQAIDAVRRKSHDAEVAARRR
ncbi:MAG: hypothetical protein [Bacteriophage sp.]|nr:MAG: hypothetical protein [Bacteriophage sp.]